MPFKGINNLRDHNETVPMERWQLDELRKCARDPMYFITNYVYINTKDDGMQLFKMWDFQKDVIQKYVKHRFNILKFPRQSGKSMTTMAYLLWYSLFHKSKVVVILANKLSLAQEQLQHLRDAYVSLPYWMQPGVSTWAKREVRLSHGTRIKCAATSPDTVRGMAINLLYLDEFAFVKPHIAEEFIASVFPTISSGKTTKVIMTSTPCGMNHFYKMWQKALGDYDVTEEGNGYTRSEIAWNVVPGRDEKWAREEQARIGEIRFNQEYKCDFIGSISTLIDHNYLKGLKHTDPMKIPKLPDYVKIWALPENPKKMEVKNWEYVASLDSGYGIHADYTVLQICLVKSNITIHQVAKIATNNMDIDEFCKKARNLLKCYGDPRLIIEQNGPGIAAMQFFHLKAEYEDIMHFHPTGKQMGLWATDRLKETACILLKTCVQRNFLKLKDEDTIEELHSFGKLTQKKWGGLGGNHDDHVTSMYWITYYVNTPFFYGNIVDVDMKKVSEDELLLTTAEERDVTAKVHNDVKDPNFHMEELQKGAEFLPELQNQGLMDENGEDIDGGLFFRR